MKKKEYKFITIMDEGNTFDGRSVYHIVNNKDQKQIGMLAYYRPWNQYVFESVEDSVFNNSCLRHILDFMDKEA